MFEKKMDSSGRNCPVEKSVFNPKLGKGRIISPKELCTAA